MGRYGRYLTFLSAFSSPGLFLEKIACTISISRANGKRKRKETENEQNTPAKQHGQDSGTWQNRKTIRILIIFQSGLQRGWRKFPNIL
jgi:hypothetical protein